jgi:hypothetical protein
MSDTNEEIVKLQNRVAELEEDKGNLQLHLVDFDELKGKNKNFKTKYVFHPHAPLSCGCGAGMFWQVMKMLHEVSFTTDNPKQNFTGNMNTLVVYRCIREASLTWRIFHFRFNINFLSHLLNLYQMSLAHGLLQAVSFIYIRWQFIKNLIDDNL